VAFASPFGPQLCRGNLGPAYVVDECPRCTTGRHREFTQTEVFEYLVHHHGGGLQAIVMEMKLKHVRKKRIIDSIVDKMVALARYSPSKASSRKSATDVPSPPTSHAHRKERPSDLRRNSSMKELHCSSASTDDHSAEDVRSSVTENWDQRERYLSMRSGLSPYKRTSSSREGDNGDGHEIDEKSEH
jgi:hypothetical protein